MNLLKEELGEHDPRMTPGRPQDGPGRDGPRSAPARPHGPPGRPQEATRSPQGRLRRPLEAPGRLSGGPQDAPRTVPDAPGPARDGNSRNAPKTLPERPRDAPRTAPDAPGPGPMTTAGQPQDGPRTPPDGPRNPQSAPVPPNTSFSKSFGTSARWTLPDAFRTPPPKRFPDGPRTASARTQTARGPRELQFFQVLTPPDSLPTAPKRFEVALGRRPQDVPRQPEDGFRTAPGPPPEVPSGFTDSLHAPEPRVPDAHSQTSYAPEPRAWQVNRGSTCARPTRTQSFSFYIGDGTVIELIDQSRRV